LQLCKELSTPGKQRPWAVVTMRFLTNRSFHYIMKIFQKDKTSLRDSFRSFLFYELGFFPGLLSGLLICFLLELQVFVHVFNHVDNLECLIPSILLWIDVSTQCVVFTILIFLSVSSLYPVFLRIQERKASGHSPHSE
jgi:hypothetical protein